MKCCFIVLIGMVLTYVPARAQSYALVPKPFHTELSVDNFTLSINQQIECTAKDSFFQVLFKDWIKEIKQKKVQKNKMVQTRISVQWVGAKKWPSYLQKLQLNAQFSPGNEGYVLHIEKNSILLLGQTETALFYGLQSLKQLFNLPTIPCGTIYDKPSFSIRAWQDDVSRGPIPTLDNLKKQIRLYSSYKLNYFSLYTENVFNYVSHPTLAPADGLKPEEIVALKEYATLYHVTLIANQQSFGHMEKVLANPLYSSLGEAGHILSPANKATYELLQDLYKEQVAAYGGEYFHINADETFGLGTGLSKQMAAEIGKGKLYAYHIQKVYSLLQKHQQKVLMWSDIVADYPEIIPILPKDLIQIPWAYDPRASFRQMLTPIAQAGFEFWVAPGISNWQNIYPNRYDARVNMFNLIRDGFALGAKGVYNTSWDDGGFALGGNNAPGFIWGADLSWNTPKADEQVSTQRWHQFSEALDLQFWKVPISSLEQNFALIHQNKQTGLLSNVSFFDPIFPIYPSQTNVDFEKANQQTLQLCLTTYKSADSLLSKLTEPNEAGDYFLFAIRECEFICRKNLLRMHYQQFLDDNFNKTQLLEEWKTLLAQLQNISADFTFLYLQESRNFFLNENLNRLNQLYTSIEDLPYHCLLLPEIEWSRKGRKYSFVTPLCQEKITYTLDGSIPTLTSKQYSKPFYVKSDVNLQYAVWTNAHMRSLNKDTFLFHKAIGSINKLSIPYSKYHVAYSGGGFQALTDGRTANGKNLKSGRWQGYAGKDLSIDLALKGTQKLNSFEMSFYQNALSWVLLPSAVQLFVSTDGINYSDCGSITHNIPNTSDSSLVYCFRKSLNGLEANYVRVVVKYGGALPPGHASAGSASMYFADEIILK